MDRKYFWIDGPKTDKPGPAKVTFRVSGNPGPELASQTVQVGDLVWIGKHAHRVKTIVLSDPKRQLIGWCDLEQATAEKKK